MSNPQTKKKKRPRFSQRRFLLSETRVQQPMSLRRLSKHFQASLAVAFLLLTQLPNAAALTLQDPSQTAEQQRAIQSSKIDFTAHPECAPDWIFPKVSLQTDLLGREVSADNMAAPNKNKIRLTGNVTLFSADQAISANRVRINKQNKTINLFGQVNLQDAQFLAIAQTGFMDELADETRLSNLNYQFIQSRAYGTADALEAHPNAKKSRLFQASYTNCPVTQTLWGQPKVAWQLDLNEFEVDNHTRRAYGYHTVLSFQQLPILYIPYFSFPLDDRASGLLFPNFGSRRSATYKQLEKFVSLPYYFYIAPNYDDTLTLTHITQRGDMFDNEFRYLAKKHSATFTLTAIDDQISKQQGLAHLEGKEVVFGEPVSTRWRTKLIAKQQWFDGLTSDLNWQTVSDPYVFADLPIDTSARQLNIVERQANLNYRKEAFQAKLSLVDNLRLGYAAPFNYEKRPGLVLSYGQPFGQTGFSYQLDAEAVTFDIKKIDHHKPEGQRLYLHPALRYQARSTWGLLEASSQAHSIRYRMDTPYFDNSSQLSQTLLQHKIKGGLIFERNLALANKDFIQTLEPTVQYLYTPYVAQYQAPIFDTALNSLDFSNLFSSNRFSGYDRIGDTEQVSLALETKLFTDEGVSLGEMGVGQIHYFRNRKVNLSQTDPDTLSQLPDEQTQTASDFFAKFNLTLPSYNLSLTSQHNKKNLNLTNLIGRTKINLTDQFLLLLTGTLSQYTQSNETKEVTTGLRWQATNNWLLGGYLNYNWTQADHTLNRALSIRYDDCCWASELTVNQEEIGPKLYNYGFSYMLELKGLSTLGRPFNEFLTNKLNF